MCASDTNWARVFSLSLACPIAGSVALLFASWCLVAWLDDDRFVCNVFVSQTVGFSSSLSFSHFSCHSVLFFFVFILCSSRCNIINDSIQHLQSSQLDFSLHSHRPTLTHACAVLHTIKWFMIRIFSSSVACIFFLLVSFRLGCDVCVCVCVLHVLVGCNRIEWKRKLVDHSKQIASAFWKICARKTTFLRGKNERYKRKTINNCV